MVLTNKNTEAIYVRCDCGCEGIIFDKIEFDDGTKEYFILNSPRILPLLQVGDELVLDKL